MKKSEQYKHVIKNILSVVGGDCSDDDFEALEMLFEEYRRELNAETWRADHENDKR